AASLAHLWATAGNADKERHFMAVAGNYALRNSAYTEAGRFFSRALEILLLMPDTPQRLQQELGGQVSLGTLSIFKGYASPAVVSAMGRAWEICQQIGSIPQI